MFDTWTRLPPASAPCWSYETQAACKPPTVSADSWTEAPPHRPSGTSAARNLTRQTTCQSASGREAVQSVIGINSVFLIFKEVWWGTAQNIFAAPVKQKEKQKNPFLLGSNHYYLLFCTPSGRLRHSSETWVGRDRSCAGGGTTSLWRCLWRRKTWQNTEHWGLIVDLTQTCFHCQSIDCFLDLSISCFVDRLKILNCHREGKKTEHLYMDCLNYSK